MCSTASGSDCAALASPFVDHGPETWWCDLCTISPVTSSTPCADARQHIDDVHVPGMRRLMAALFDLDENQRQARERYAYPVRFMAGQPSGPSSGGVAAPDQPGGHR